MIKLVPITDVRPSTYNPRKADPRRLDVIELSLRKLGFVLPIYADSTGEILSGHQRHHVATRMGYTHVPVVYTKKLPLHIRKAINVAFNRGTNDLRASDTPANLTEALERASLDELCRRLPDVAPGSEASFPCLAARSMPLGPLLTANRGRWVEYARNVARMLANKGVFMPIVATPDLRVVNGIGRLQLLAEKKADHADVVIISQDQAALADAMLNLLSMDFDIHSRYADLLRYNSFRRPRGRRTYLGRAFTFALIGSKPSKSFDVTKPAARARWIKKFGGTVLDWGAGLLDETRILKSVGVDCTPFEPFLLKPDNQTIDRAGAMALTREFLSEVAAGKRWSSIFMSAVLNSVPFIEDRRHILALLAELAYPAGVLYTCSSSTKQAGYQIVAGKEFANRSDASRLQFQLNYEPRITLADFGATPKVQKYHTPAEFKALIGERFGAVVVSESSNNVNAIASKPQRPSWADLEAACRFEFDLPYPDGQRLGLASEAIKAFKARREIIR